MRVTRRQIVESLIDNGVVSNLELMAIFEDEDSRIGGWLGVGIIFSLGRVFRLRLCCVRFGWRFVAWGNVGGWSVTPAIEDGGATLIVGIAVVGGSVVEHVRGVGHWNRVHVGVVVIRQRDGCGALRTVVAAVRAGGWGRSPGGGSDDRVG